MDFPAADSKEFSATIWSYLPDETPFLSALERMPVGAPLFDWGGGKNCTQIMRQIVVSPDDLPRKALRLKRDMEFAIRHNGAPDFGSATKARTLRGLRDFEPSQTEGDPNQYWLAVLRDFQLSPIGASEAPDRRMLVVEFGLHRRVEGALGAR